MNEKKEVDVLSKKHPTVKELKTEIICLRKSNEKSNANLDGYKTMYEGVCHENKELRNMSSKLNSAKNQLEANNKAYEELKAKRQYNTVDFVIASLIALGAVAIIILRFSIIPIRTLFN